MRARSLPSKGRATVPQAPQDQGDVARKSVPPPGLRVQALVPNVWYFEDGVWGLQELDEVPRVEPPSRDQCPRPKKRKGERRAGGRSLQTRGVFSPGTESASAVILDFSSRTVRNNCPLFVHSVCLYT